MTSRNIASEIARILCLVYGRDAIEMAELRCRELLNSGDVEALKAWGQVLGEVKHLLTTDPRDHGAAN